MLAEAKARQIQTGVAYEEEMRKSGVQPTCRKGCSNCCSHPFLITVSEGILLYRWLVEHGKWNRSLRQHLEETKDKTLGLSFDVWLMANIPCPLLQQDTQTCGAYEGRPLHCRVTFSSGSEDLCHPHQLGVNTPLVPNADTIVNYTQEMRDLLKKLGVYGSLMPLSSAVLLGETIDTGKLTLEESDREYLRGLHGGF
jgi:Fe-S-cluster containining protein